MRNVETTVSPDGKKLTIEIDLEAEGEVSASGKSVVLATTRGNQPVEGHPALKLGVNLYTANPNPPAKKGK